MILDWLGFVATVVIILVIAWAFRLKKNVRDESPPILIPPDARNAAVDAGDCTWSVKADGISGAAFQPILFEFDSADLSSDGHGVLETIAKTLEKYPAISLLIEGHCDERGSAEYNMGLGVQRADAVKRWLLKRGIAKSRLEATSHGKERPAFKICSNDACHAKNRRVEFKIFEKTQLGLWEFHSTK